MVAGPIIQDEVIEIKRNPWADNFFRPFLITVMIMCLSVALVNMVQLINPAWRGFYFLVGMLVVTIEAIYSYRLLKYHRLRGTSIIRYRVAEIVVLILVLKILNFMGKSWAIISQELQIIWSDPSNLISLEFYMIIFLAFLAWMAASSTSADFEALYNPYRDNRSALDSLAERFFWGGGILLVISGLTQWIAQYGVASLIDWQRPFLNGIIFNVLIYFMVGLVLLSQVNLTTLQVRWRVQKITVAGGLVRQWAKYGFVFLGIVTVLAFILPTRYSLGFLTTIAYLLQFLINLVIFFFQLVLLLITILLSQLLNIFGGTPIETGHIPVMPPLPPSGGNAETSTPAWLEVIQSLIFWVVSLAIVGYLLKIYINDHAGVFKQLKRLKLVKLLFNFLAQLGRQFMVWGRMGLAMLPQSSRGGGKEEGQATAQLWHWLSLRRLSPRERIVSYYLNILKRAKKEGIPRQSHQTPYEYEARLSQSVPTVQAEVQDLTDTFMQARYSQDTYDEKQAKSVKQQWQKIRNALRRGNNTTAD